MAPGLEEDECRAQRTRNESAPCRQGDTPSCSGAVRVVRPRVGLARGARVGRLPALAGDRRGCRRERDGRGRGRGGRGCLVRCLEKEKKGRQKARGERERVREREREGGTEAPADVKVMGIATLPVT